MIAVLVILSPVWQPGFPWGSDTWGHLQRAHQMGETIRQHGLLDGFLKSAWMPDWYLGDPTRVYYPPVVLWILGPLTALVGDVFIAYRIFVTGFFLSLSLSVYTIGYRWGSNRWAALMGGLLATMAPYTLRTVFVEGNLARCIAILPLPWLVWYTEIILRYKYTRKAFVLLGFLWAFALTAHVMQATIFAVAIGVYVVVRVLWDVYIPLRRGLLALLPIPIGALLAAFYLLPAYSHLELKNVPSLPGEKIGLFSITPDNLLPYHTSIEAVSVGLVVAGLALAVTFGSANAHRKALFVTAMVCIVLAFGPAGGLFQLVPMNQSLLPERFLNASAIMFPLILAGFGAEPFKRRYWLLLGFVLVFSIDFMPAWRGVHMRAAPPDETAIAAVLAERNLPGRVAPLTYPNPTAQQIYLTSVIGKHDNVSGWALENTPHQEVVRRLLTAIDRSPQYLQRILSLWNADYLVTRFANGLLTDSLDDSLTYQPITASNDLQLWERTTPSAFVQTVPDNRMLVIGDNATSWLFAFPFASEGESANPAAYTADELSHYSVIGLSRFTDGGDIERSLGDWVRQGNTLIVDLSGVGSIYDRGFTLFGVHTLPFTINGATTSQWPNELQSLSGATHFPVSEGPWVGATYYGLDQVVATLNYQGEEHALLGYQNVGKGRVWFVGFNLLYLFDSNGNQNATDTLVNYLLTDTHVNRDLVLPSIPVQSLERSAMQVQFRYTSDSPTNAILSMTYFPRWQAELDGQPSDISSYEHLTRLKLPAGTHTVTLTYHPYGGISRIGAAVSLVLLVSIALVAYGIKRWPVLAREDREGHFEDRLPQPVLAPETGTRYETCPNCGYAQAIVQPPTAETYPFVSIECPSCGYKL